MRFVDSSFWVALQFTRDDHHDEARRIWGEIGTDAPLLTSNHVLGETWTFLRRRLGHSEAVVFADAVTKSPRMTIVHLDERAESTAWQWLRRHDERRYSFVDATSFALMRALRVREALAFDGAFSAAGFVEVH